MSKIRYIFLGGIGIVLTILSFLSWPTCLIWNRTPSIDVGFYWIEKRYPKLDEIAILSASSKEAKWTQFHGFSGKHWPLLKRISGENGDIICRKNTNVFVNDKLVSKAFHETTNGLKLPAWNGCQQLKPHEVFLLNAHPNSLDGRYFGTTFKDQIIGTAIPIWTFSKMEQFRLENELQGDKQKLAETGSLESGRARFRGRHLWYPNLLSAHHFLGTHLTLPSIRWVPNYNLSDCILYYLVGTQPKVCLEQ